MAQPAGLVLRIPSKHGYLLRVSPIVCAGDALHSLISLVCYTIYLKSPSAAVDLVTKRRFHESEDSEVARLQQSWGLRLAILVFGALPQILKLYGMNGVPWTTAWGSLYIGSFVVLEPLVIAQQKSGRNRAASTSGIANSSHSNRDERPALEKALSHITVAIGAIIPSYFLASAIHDVIAKTRVSYVPHIVATSMVAVFTLLSVILLEGKRFKWTEALMMLLMFMGLTLTIVLFMPLATAIASTQSVRDFLLSLSGSLLLALGLLGVLLFWSFWRPKSRIDQSKENMDLVLKVLFFIRVLSAAFAYYAIKYDSNGTVKPPWANQLG